MIAHPNVHPVFDADILDGVQLLEADAGTGKTWTIAGLVVRALVERALELDRVLVVTFTNAAAAELAERIRLRIAQLERLLDDRLEGRPQSHGAPGGVDEPFCVAYAAGLDDAAARRARDLLRVALARVDEMSVHTIHAWCQRVIDEHALSIGVPRGLPIGVGDGARIARRVADWWRREVLDAPIERLALFVLAGIDPEAIERSVAAVVSLPLARVASPPCEWRTLASRAFAARAALVDAMRTDAADLRAWIAVPANVSGQMKLRHAAWFDNLQAFCDAPLARMSRETVERFGSHRFAKSMPDSAVPGCCDALLAIDEELAGLRASVAQEIAASLRETRAEDLAQANSLAFDDLLGLVHEALVDPVSGPALARALRARHPVALVDECQDTDPLQWDIVRRIYAPVDGDAEGSAVERGSASAGRSALACGSALVLVGDPKQAIYSFRRADVHSYLGARASATRTHRLGENQRSHPALIEAVNALFDVDDPFRVDGITFSPAAVGVRERRAFDPADPPDAGARAPMTVVALEPGADGRQLLAPQARRQAIDATVAEIARLLASPTHYDGRPLQPKDIAVLVQVRAQGASIKRALARAGIGAAEITRDSVLDTLEGAEVSRIVAAVDDCTDPARLRAALTTTLLGFDAASLLALEADAVRMAEIAARFAEARLRWERQGPIASLRPLLHAFGVPARLAALVDGERRLTNLEHLISLVVDDAAVSFSPREALRAWARMRARPRNGDDETRELRLESDENLVRILTVHKSKGLEFPIVFLPFAWSAWKAQAPDPCVRHERDADGTWRTLLDLAPDQAADDEAAAERATENLRTLYVALTRAEQRCYVFWGWTSGSQYAPLNWLLHERAASSREGEPLRSREGEPLRSRQGGSLRSREDGPFALDADGVRAALEHWQARAALRHPDAVAVVDTPTLLAYRRGAAQPGATAHGAPPEQAADRTLAAREWNATIPAASVTTSFSAIAAALVGDETAWSPSWQNVDVVDPERDAATQADDEPDRLPADAATGESDSIRFRFPAGAQAGVCLHGILEQAAFDEPLDPQLVVHWLGRCGYRRQDALRVRAWLDDALRVPLPAPGGGRLSLTSVPRARQLREMEFHLRARDVSDRALVETLDRTVSDGFAADTSTRLRRWSGFLRGFVDLVFEHGGRWYIVDWKSNHLGEGAARYGEAALHEAMHAHAYPLQAGLYTLAVHRWLRRSLPGYDYEHSFGGVFYVFLRGAGLEVPDDPRVPVPGVHASRPALHTIERLDRLFDGAGGERRR